MVQIEVVRPNEIGPEGWREIQVLEREALKELFPNVPHDTIGEFVKLGDPQAYIRSHTHPNSKVGAGFRSGQVFDTPKVAVAYDDDKPVGFVYGAGNVSGPNAAVRFAKRLTTPNHYFNIRTAVVSPEYRRQEVATAMAKYWLGPVNPDRPVSAVIWPGLMPWWQTALERHGFEAVGPPFDVKMFSGEAPSDLDVVPHQLMKAPSVRHVLDLIKRHP